MRLVEQAAQSEVFKVFFFNIREISEIGYAELKVRVQKKSVVSVISV